MNYPPNPQQPPNSSNPQWTQGSPYPPGQTPPFYPGQPMQRGSYPPQYPGQMQRPPMMPPKKPMPRWQKILIAAAIIFIGIPVGINSAVQSWNSQTAKATATAAIASQKARPSPTPSPSPIPKPTPKPEDRSYQLGEYVTIVDGAIEWRIGGSEATIDPGPVTELDETGFHEFTAQPGNVFLVVKLSMQNTGEDSQEVRNDMWELQDKDGHTYPSLSDVSYQDVASVAPSRRLDAELVYEIPAGQKVFYLLFRLKEGSKPIMWLFAV